MEVVGFEPTLAFIQKVTGKLRPAFIFQQGEHYPVTQALSKRILTCVSYGVMPNVSAARRRACPGLQQRSQPWTASPSMPAASQYGN